jgi:hypothetical protein
MISTRGRTCVLARGLLNRNRAQRFADNFPEATSSTHKKRPVTMIRQIPESRIACGWCKTMEENFLCYSEIMWLFRWEVLGIKLVPPAKGTEQTERIDNTLEKDKAGPSHSSYPT